jgi:hypothetical protein
MTRYDMPSAIVATLANQPATLVVGTADASAAILLGEIVYQAADYRRNTGVPITAGAEYLCGFVGSKLIVICELT